MKITKRGLQATLRDSVFTPSEPGPLKVIAEVGGADYYIQRAIEMCQTFLYEPKIDQLTQAISLLAMAKLHHLDWHRRLNEAATSDAEQVRKEYAYDHSETKQCGCK